MKELNIKFSTGYVPTEKMKYLQNMIDSYGKDKYNLIANKTTYSFMIEDIENKIYGVLICDHLYDEFRINFLCVDESLRGQGYGIKLMKKAEEHAKKLGFKYITLNTREFQAPKFYQKMGFEIEFIRESKNPLLKKYFLIKNLHNK